MTAVQLELGLPEVPRLPGKPTIDERFAEFHRLNGWVLRDLIRLADDEIDNGARRIGVKALYEVLRWHHLRATQGDTFRLNNDFTSRFARLICETRPDLAEYIERRALADERTAA